MERRMGVIRKWKRAGSDDNNMVDVDEAERVEYWLSEEPVDEILEELKPEECAIYVVPVDPTAYCIYNEDETQSECMVVSRVIKVTVVCTNRDGENCISAELLLVNDEVSLALNIISDALSDKEARKKAIIMFLVKVLKHPEKSLVIGSFNREFMKAVSKLREDVYGLEDDIHYPEGAKLEDKIVIMEPCRLIEVADLLPLGSIMRVEKWREAVAKLLAKPELYTPSCIHLPYSYRVDYRAFETLYKLIMKHIEELSGENPFLDQEDDDSDEEPYEP